MKKILRIVLITVLIIIAITTVTYTVLKDTKNNEEKKESTKQEEKSNTNENKENKLEDNNNQLEGYKSNIEDLVTSEKSKEVLDELKSGDNNLIFKEPDGTYYEFYFKNDKIIDIYFYVECGNEDVADYMLKSYTTDEMKQVYSQVEIYKKTAIKAKLSKELTTSYSKYTKETLKQNMEQSGHELR